VIASDAGDNQLQNGFELERGIALPAAQCIVKHALPEVSEMIFQNSDGACGIEARQSVHGDSQGYNPLPERDRPFPDHLDDEGSDLMQAAVRVAGHQRNRACTMGQSLFPAFLKNHRVRIVENQSCRFRTGQMEGPLQCSTDRVQDPRIGAAQVRDERLSQSLLNGTQALMESGAA
jgi:hypothetical protein